MKRDQREVEPRMGIECPHRLHKGLLPTEAVGAPPYRESRKPAESAINAHWHQESVLCWRLC